MVQFKVQNIIESPCDTVGENVLRSANESLKKFNLNTGTSSSSAAEAGGEGAAFSAPDLLPPLYGNIESHFHRIADEQVRSRGVRTGGHNGSLI